MGDTRSETMQADALPCTVVVVPTHGFGNRMRMLSCAYAYAAHHGCVLRALWRTTLHMPTPWEELFATKLSMLQAPSQCAHDTGPLHRSASSCITHSTRVELLRAESGCCGAAFTG